MTLVKHLLIVRTDRDIGQSWRYFERRGRLKRQIIRNVSRGRN